MTKIDIFETVEALNLAGAEAFARLTASAVKTRGMCAVALAGGSTPRGMYRSLADTPAIRAEVPWDRIRFFWGDERFVPPDHAESNYRMASETLLSKIPVRPEQIHRVRTEAGDPDRVAQEYETEMLTTVRLEGGMPRFDLVLLGLGRDGHTASLFPATPALAEPQRLCAANWVSGLGAHRITVTLPLINAARCVIFLVSGVDKAAIVREVLRPGRDRRELPAQRVRPSGGDIVWMLDRAAASALETRP